MIEFPAFGYCRLKYNVNFTIPFSNTKGLKELSNFAKWYWSIYLKYNLSTVKQLILTYGPASMQATKVP